VRATPTADFAVGVDVGSTTVKAVAVEPRSLAVLWTDYRRHRARQADTVLEVLNALAAWAGRDLEGLPLFLTGSGGPALAADVGGRYVQEVHAEALAAERLQPGVGTVIELGGQDAKMIVWLPDPGRGTRRFCSMNDRCAGGTGAVLDKIRARLGLDEAAVRRVRYDPGRLHPVAGKCGVFAETDIVGLQKQGVPPEDLLASLCDAIVQQNLRVLARGQILRPPVLLLGGPNRFVPVLEEAWRANLAAHWRERGVELPAGAMPESLVVVPDLALHFPAVGAVLHGLDEGLPARSRGLAGIRAAAPPDRDGGGPALVADEREADEFARRFRFPSVETRSEFAGPVYLGVDAGSTSTKAVLLDPGGRLLAAAYRLSAGNPVEDTKEVLRAIAGCGAPPAVAGVGVTGYARHLLRDVIGADLAVVETVAHARSAARHMPEVEVVCDVGGQDIKVLFMRRGRIWDFRLNTQCSAGNGYFLQATATRFGLAVEEFAAAAFRARRAPAFQAGCAVFLETDIVNAQQLGWSPEEILAGLARVLPKNVWLHVVQEPDLARFGRRFLLQGGTQRNLAALKAQVDFIRSRVPDAEVRVHPYPGECGAIGAALEAIQRCGAGPSRFVGFEALDRLRVDVRKDESTRCRRCRNACLRTFIRAVAPDGSERRMIVATCERGAQEDPALVREAHRRMRAVRERAPDLVDLAARRAFQRLAAPSPDGGAPRGASAAAPRVGIPRVLDLYSVAPFFTAYLEAAGVPFARIVFSDPTGEALFREGSRRGAVDPCFPVKAALAHVHQLVVERRVDLVFFPRLVTLPALLPGACDSMACPAAAAAPEVVRAALTRPPDLLAARGVEFLSPTLHMGERGLFARQMLEAWGSRLGLSAASHERAMRAGWSALDRFLAELRAAGDRVLSRVEREGGLAVVMLGRPYHGDPGVNHGIPEAIQRLGYPVLPIEALPVDEARIARLFGEGGPPVGIHFPEDAARTTYSENSTRKLWAARYVARHPNLAAVDLSSFRCGHDAPIYDVVQRALDESGTPCLAFHDLDENRPAASLEIRLETLAFFLDRHAENLPRPAPGAGALAARG